MGEHDCRARIKFELHVARLVEVVQNATPRSPAARRTEANSSTESSPEPATSSRACRAPPTCRIPTASSRIPAATRRYGAVPSSNLAAMSANKKVQGGVATLCLQFGPIYFASVRRHNFGCGDHHGISCRRGIHTLIATRKQPPARVQSSELETAKDRQTLPNGPKRPRSAAWRLTHRD